MMKTEEGQEQQQEIDNDPLNINLLNVDHLDDELLNDSFLKEGFNLVFQQSSEVSQPYSKKFPLLSLDASLFQRIGEFLPPHDVLQLAQVSRDCLITLASHFNIELSLVNKTLTEQDFLNYFKKADGLYKEAQCFSLTWTSFHPDWLNHIPKILKTLKLRGVRTDFFSEYGFENALAMKIKILRSLGQTLPDLKYLHISGNHLGDEEARHLA